MEQHLPISQGRFIEPKFNEFEIFFFIFRQQETLQRAREELDRERRNLLRRRPNFEVKEKPTKISVTRAKSKDRGNSLAAANDESSNDGIKGTDTNKKYV